MRHALAPALLALVATQALAHGPTPQKVNQSITIAAKPEAVWKVAGDFGKIAGWNPALKASEGVAGGKPGEAEGKRTLTFPNGARLVESLDEWNGSAFKYSYRMSDPEVKALPVSSYSATLSVAPEGEGAKVTWSGRFYRGDTGNEPPDDLSDAAGRTAMDAFFAAGLKGLKAKVEPGAGH
ncbi:SRPBCC family protein [Methylobacterium sp. WL103]|nr:MULTISPECIES: SRPBCC family protein [Methylobacterium]TXN00867.1 SRPBCC family protein [Methylobacterium sp. WL103]